jgi:hypothetical protein
MLPHLAPVAQRVRRQQDENGENPVIVPEKPPTTVNQVRPTIPCIDQSYVCQRPCSRSVFA